MHLLLTILVAIVADAGHVLAGSRIWQPDVNKGRLNSRSFAINTDRFLGTNIPWPNSQIRYCFDSAESRDVLNNMIIAAHDLWLRNGLDSEFTISEVGEEECRDHRFDTLKISYTGPTGSLSTFPGLPAPGSWMRMAENPETRPKSMLTTSVHKGMLDPVANIAHELGHAWGLMHEHQNPAFWGEGTVSNGQGGTVFGPENNGNWRCELLLDYEEKVAGSGEARMKKLCEDYDTATFNKFSASEYLPMPQDMGVAGTSGKSGKDVDWKSIMIYPSGAGARGDASPGNDNRAAILLQPDGSRIPINDHPSQKDIAALRKLYEIESKPMKLLQMVGGSRTADFRRLYSSRSRTNLNDAGAGCL